MLPCRPQEHHIIDRDIRDLAVCCDLAGVGQNIGLLYMIILVFHESAQRTVDGVVLAGLDLDGDGGQAVVIVDQIIDLAFVAVIIVKQLAAVSGQLLGHHAFIHGAEIDPGLIVQDRADIAAVQNVGQKPHVVQIELEQILAYRLRKREHRRGDRVDVQDDPRGDQIFKFVLIIGETLAALILDILKNDPLLLALQIGGDHVIDPADFQLFVVVRFVLRRIIGIERADIVMDRSYLYDVGIGKKRVHGVRQPADQQILLEKIHDLLMRGDIQTLTGQKLLTHRVDRKTVEAVRKKKLFEVQREHALDLNAADRDRARLLQGHAEQRTAGDVGELVVLLQEFEHGQQMGIGLNLVEEDQRVFLLAHFLAGDGADLEIKVLDRADRLKHTGAVLILREVQLDIVFKKLLPDVADDKGLTDLPRTVDNQHFVGV